MQPRLRDHSSRAAELGCVRSGRTHTHRALGGTRSCEDARAPGPGTDRIGLRIASSQSR